MVVKMHPDYQQPRTGAEVWEYALYPTAIGVPYWAYKGYKAVTSDDTSTPSSSSSSSSSSTPSSAFHDDTPHEHRHGGGRSGRGGHREHHDGVDWTTVAYVGIGVTAAVGLAYIIMSRAKKA